MLDEFLAHGRAVRAERARAALAGEEPDFIALVRSWGGVTIAYRKRMVDSPAYRLNHEEVIKALEEGIVFAENLNPIEAVPDDDGAVTSLIFKREGKDASNALEILPARTVLVAAGTSPNIIYERERAGTFQLDAKKKFFQPHRVVTATAVVSISRRIPWASSPRTNPAAASSPTTATTTRATPATSSRRWRRRRTAFRKSWSCSPTIWPRSTRRCSRRATRTGRRLVARLDEELVAVVEDVVRLTPTIVEVIVRAPAAARHFHPGQFYRLQNYETSARRVGGVPLIMEGIALTGAWVDKERGLLSLIALELGVSSRLVAYLRKGEPVVVMGPTGAPTEIPHGQNVLLLGGGLGNAVLFSIAKAMRENGNRVIYFAGYRKGEDLFKREDIESATDQVVWSTDTGDAIAPRRPQDAHFRGNIVQAMLAYEAGQLGRQIVPLSTVDRIIAIGSDRMMAAVKAARHGVLASHLKADARRHREHQLADAVHDEGSLRPVPAEARRSGDRQGVDHLLLLQPGSGAGPRRFPEPGGAAASEHRAGKAVEPVARPSSEHGAGGSHLRLVMKNIALALIAGLVVAASPAASSVDDGYSCRRGYRGRAERRGGRGSLGE